MNVSAENRSPIPNSQTDSSIQSKPQYTAMDDYEVYSSSNYSEENESSSSFDGNKSISTQRIRWLREVPLSMIIVLHLVQQSGV